MNASPTTFNGKSDNVGYARGIVDITCILDNARKHHGEEISCVICKTVVVGSLGKNAGGVFAGV